MAPLIWQRNSSGAERMIGVGVHDGGRGGGNIVDYTILKDVMQGMIMEHDMI